MSDTVATDQAMWIDAMNALLFITLPGHTTDLTVDFIGTK